MAHTGEVLWQLCLPKVTTLMPHIAACSVCSSTDTKITNAVTQQHVCRVPDELKKQSITDREGLQYSTNLDRNRYGDDNQYLATVIRYNLEFLHMCPCLVTVEIINAKSGASTALVAAPERICSCLPLPRRVSTLCWPCMCGCHAPTLHLLCTASATCKAHA